MAAYTQTRRSEEPDSANLTDGFRPVAEIRKGRLRGLEWTCMLLRRITEHVSAQNWTAIAIDFVIVVVGVFIGIQVSNWNEARQNSTRTQNYYSRLIDDLDSERRQLLARLDYMAVTDGYGQWALEILNDPSAERTSQFLIALYQASQIWTYSVQRATYDEILSSGVAEAIPESGLRTQLANVYLNAEATRQVIVTITPYRQQIRLFLPNAIQTAVRESCDDQYIPTERNLLILKLPETCAIEFKQDQIAEAIQALDEYPLLARELVQRLASIAVSRSAIQAHLGLIDSLIEELRIRRR